MSQIIYIAGKVTNLPTDQVWLKFKKKEEELRDLGHQVINPVTLITHTAKYCNPEQTENWQKIMRICVSHLACADEIHLLPCWQESKGAILEHDIARRLGIKIVYP